MRNIPFAPPDITEAEISAVADAMRSGWITTGARAKELEGKVASACGCAGAVCLNSATACLEMALRLLGVGPGDEVITSAYTYTASASPAVHVGARLVLADTAPGSYEMDYGQLEALVTERTKAVIPVDLGGVMCDYGRIFDIVRQKSSLFRPANALQKAIGRVAVIADAAHAFGASQEGRMCGSVADFTSFSFHAVKNLTTAEGFALTWRAIPGVDDGDIYRELMLLSLHGQSKDAFHKSRAGAWEYDVLSPAYKCNMTDIAAAMGLAQLGRYPGMLARRREVIARYDGAFAPYGLDVLPHFSGGQPFQRAPVHGAGPRLRRGGAQRDDPGPGGGRDSRQRPLQAPAHDDRIQEPGVPDRGLPQRLQAVRERGHAAPEHPPRRR